MDEAEFHLHPGLSRMWGKVGEPLTVPAAGRDRRLPVFGALDAVTGKLIAHIADRKNSRNFLILLNHLLRRFPNRHMFLFMDNCTIHHAKVVARFLADRKKHFTAIWNAAYAPECRAILRIIWTFDGVFGVTPILQQSSHSAHE